MTSYLDSVPATSHPDADRHRRFDRSPRSLAGGVFPISWCPSCAGRLHRMRNIADKVSRKHGSCVAEASAIYRARNKSEAQQAFHQWKQRWEKRRPNAVGCVERNLDGLLNFFDVPQAHWKKVRTTNVIERAFREVRRRTRPMSSFSNSQSCDRIIFGVISHLNRSWEKKHLSEFTQDT